MLEHHIELTWLDASESMDLPELARASGMSMQELTELVDYGALEPLQGGAPMLSFSAACVMRLRKVGQLRGDYDLDLFTAALLMDYLTQIEALEQRVRALQAALPAAPAH